jgi:hypothetical protein
MTLDTKRFSVGLVITGLLEMVEKEGLTPREAFETLDEIKKATWSALNEIRNETKK